ncbi:HTH domain-containing protein [Candidatus Woesearchaeota archaeon]|nr:HTH domain-containing protein [Candidatus Woesearchaeota archaeon]
MNEIKEAFTRVKQDILALKTELESIKMQLKNIENQLDSTKINSTQTPVKTTTSTHIPTLRQEAEGLKPQNLDISTGNEGVPTDRQTNQQTDISTQNYLIQQEKQQKPTFEQATKILESLDNIKKEIRLKFKRLTNQEMAIFSTLYQLEQTQPETTYKHIAHRLKLSESSIRDYISRLINKGIPIEKIRKNNKQIILKISQDLTKIASLDTILQLRGI